MDVVVYGAGAVGLGLASALGTAGARLRIVARADTVAALRSGGLRRTGLFGEVRVPPDALDAAESVETLASRAAADFVLVCVKSFDSEDAAASLADAREVVGDGTRIVLCQNGWGNADAFLRHFDEDRVWNARVITGFRRPSAAHVDVTVHAEPLHVGHLDGRDPAPVAALCDAIARGGIPCEPTTGIVRDLWAKLLYNGLLNPLGAICGVPYGALGESPHTRATMERVAHEIFAVMHAAGFDTHWPDPERYLEAFYRDLLPPTARHESSMLQDLRAGKRTEIDALLGPVLRMGAEDGVPAATCRTLDELCAFSRRAGPGPPRPAGRPARTAPRAAARARRTPRWHPRLGRPGTSCA